MQAGSFYITKLYFHCRLSQQLPDSQQVEWLSADSLNLACKIIFAEYGLQWKMMSDVGYNFTSEKFKISVKV